MTLSLFFVIFWTISRGASAVRPSALQRGYAHIWLFLISWAILVFVTTAADRLKIASGYPFAFFHSAVFVSTLISLCDLFALPPKKDFVQHAHDDQQVRDNISEVPNSDALISPHPDEEVDAAEEPTETTPLRSGENGSGNNGTIRTTFATTYRRSISAIMSNHDNEEETKEASQPFENEQQWSTKLPSWTWFLQLLLLAPITIIIFLQIALFALSAIQSASADGGDSLLVYLGIAVFSIAVLLPITPFIHRATFYLPLFLLLVLIVSLIYNLVAFPFSASNRYKVYFQHDLNLDNATSHVKITGIEEYARKIIAELPSAAGKDVVCVPSRRGLLSECSYDGSSVLPKLTSSLLADFSKDKYASLVTVNVSVSNSSNKATLHIDAEESKACVVALSRPPSAVSIRGSAGVDPIFSQALENGVDYIQLWRRDWSKPWVVDVEWSDPTILSPKGPVASDKPSSEATNEELRVRELAQPRGQIWCDWSDANVLGTIPAFDEAVQFAPDWVAITKVAVGLVRGSKVF